MSFTKRDFEAVARIISHGRAYLAAYPRGADDQYQRGYGQALTRMQEELSAHFASTNPAFDRERFARDCEPKWGK